MSDSKILKDILEVNKQILACVLVNSRPVKCDFEVNKKPSLASQQHFTVADLVKTFIREKPELIANAVEEEDDKDPDFPVVDAHDDIIDLEDKIEEKQSLSQNDSKELEQIETRTNELKKEDELKFDSITGEVLSKEENKKEND